jgi:large subunit ribosomal protein L35
VPKIKTHKGAQRRFKITGTGKILHGKVGKSHLRLKKPARVKRLYNGMREIHPANRSRMKRVLPYG